jgi:hypothetical protein
MQRILNSKDAFTEMIQMNPKHPDLTINTDCRQILTGFIHSEVTRTVYESGDRLSGH